LISNYHVVKDATRVVCSRAQKADEEGRMKNEETGRQPIRAGWHFFIHPSSFFISPRRCRRM
jgi:hypothetical protein